MPRLLSFFVALLLVLVGLGSALANGSGEPRSEARVNEASLADVQGPAVQQGGEVPHSDQGAGSSATPSENDDDDDCDEPGAAPARLSFGAPFPARSSIRRFPATSALHRAMEQAPRNLLEPSPQRARCSSRNREEPRVSRTSPIGDFQGGLLGTRRSFVLTRCFFNVVAGFAFACGILIAPGAVRAESPGTLSLTLTEAVNRAMADAPEVVSGRQNVREADARRVGAGLLMPSNPRLAIDVRPSVTGGNGFRDLGYGAVLDLPLQPGGAPSARIAEAERTTSVARADLIFDRSSARLRAFTAYVKSQIADLRIAEARSAMEISNRVLNAAQRRFAAGAASELEQASAELDVALLQASEIASESERNSQLMNLRDALNLPPSLPLELTSPVADPPQLEDAARLVERAAKRHPELAALQARVTLLEATQTRLEKELFPRIEPLHRHRRRPGLARLRHHRSDRRAPFRAAQPGSARDDRAGARNRAHPPRSRIAKARARRGRSLPGL